MKLYHFTYPQRLESIQRLGIVRGDVPVGPTSSLNAPNLTSDPDPENQGWAVGGLKTAMRIEVLIPEEEVPLGVIALDRCPWPLRRCLHAPGRPA